MAEHHAPTTHTGGEEEGFDREIDVRQIVWTMAGILGLTVVSMALMWWLVSAFKSQLEENDPKLPAVAREFQAPAEPPATASGPGLPAGTLLPPGPRLQARPEDELKAFRAREDAELTTYGWVDRGAGGVHVPIARAMADLVARGPAGVAPLAPPPAVPPAAAPAVPAIPTPAGETAPGGGGPR